MWFSVLTLLIVLPPWLLWRREPKTALGATVLLSLLAPTWLSQEVFGLPAHLRFAASLAAVGLYCLHPRSKISFRLGWIDLVGLAFLSAHLITDFGIEGFQWRIPLQMYGEWFLPYVAGRLAVQDLDDVRGLLPVAVAVTALLAGIGVLESLAKVDLAVLIAGEAPLATDRPDLSRWGIKRASGTTLNPTYFGPLQLLLFPWAAYAAARARRGAAPLWWKGAPWIAVVGIGATASRGVVVGLLVLVAVQIFVLRPRARPVLAGLAVAGGAAVASFAPAAVEMLAAWGGEGRLEQLPTVEIDGEQVPRSSTLHRVYVFRVYRVAAARSGAFGFGTSAVKGFPVNVPLGRIDMDTYRYMRTVDNAYILLLLRLGFVGLACFVLLGLAAATGYLRLAWPRGGPGRVFFAASAGAILGTMTLLLGVWMPFDFGFLFLWTLGTASGLSGYRPGRSALPA